MLSIFKITITCLLSTKVSFNAVEYRFYEPSREMEIDLKYQEFEKSKLTLTEIESKKNEFWLKKSRV